ncbi:MAG: AraC family transcriptional regulator [Clostridia bacterium]|nr:AraC family transcriptional regulator [Clostridia bacterium]
MSPIWGKRNVTYHYDKIYYIIEEECEIEIEDRKYRAKPGDFFLIPSGTKHSFCNVDNGQITHYFFHFTLEANGIHILKKLNLPDFLHIGINEEIIALCDSIVRLSSQENVGAALMLKGQMLQLTAFYIMLNKNEESIDIPHENENLKNVILYINKNLNKHITLDQLTKITQMHPTAFIRLFKKQYGLPPMKYVQKEKMEYAKYLLEYTQIQISQIAAMVGFQELSHFSKNFKLYTGYSPKYSRRTYFEKSSKNKEDFD